jgi:TolA-binding protein
MTKTVIATSPGVYDHYREEGDVFEVRDDRHFSETWMQEVSASTAKKLHKAEAAVGQAEIHVVDTSSEHNEELEKLRAQLADREAELKELREKNVAPDNGSTSNDKPEKSASEVLAMASDPNVEFMTFKAAARKILGDATPSTKAEIVAALEDKATQP